MRKKIHAWVEARLWRRLMVSHLSVILGGYIVLLIGLAALIAFTGNASTPLARDASVTARALAVAASWVLENDQATQLPLLIEIARQDVIELPVPDFTDTLIDIQKEPLSVPEHWGKRVTCVVVLGADDTLLAESGDCQTRAQSAWDELIALARAGESDLGQLSRLLALEQGGMIVGAAGIPGMDGDVLGVVVVEMYPSVRPGVGPASLGSFLSFIFLIVISTALLGLPALIVAVSLALLSGVITSRALVQRLQRLEQTAQAMAAGDLSLRVAETAPDEVGQVGSAFNQMAAQLESTLHALEHEKAQVETLLRARRDMVANISHDLRTPIATLSAHLETLATHPERLEAYLAILNGEAARVSRLLNDLFDLSRLDAHELTLHLGPVAVNSVIQKVVVVYEKLAWSQKRIVVTYDPVADLPLVWADVQRVEQILVNLITNALRYTPEGGIITLETTPRADAVEVVVSDTGIGIAPEDLEHIFERFYRGDPARGQPDTATSGSGLGLSIVKGLLDAMGGDIAVDSEVGVGTNLRFTLPVAGFKS